jgi:imidazoleglycerol-phosphate dehydratase/histidinol-phosphatase
MKKILILDRDGTIIKEAEDQMLNEIHKIRFLPKAISVLSKIAQQFDYGFVMITNQDDLGGSTFPEKDFWPCHELILDTLAGEGVHFDGVYIDKHFASDNSPYRKPGTAMLKKYITGDYDLERSIVIGDRWSDIGLAKNLGSKGILIQSEYSDEPAEAEEWKESLVLQTTNWDAIYSYLLQLDREATISQVTKETSIQAKLNLDGKGYSNCKTGLEFFDHMLDQLAKHGGVDLIIQTKGDLEVDEHHTIEDTGIALGKLYKDALGKKAGINRYGFNLPMDDCLAEVAIDFGGRPWIVWDAEFNREKVGDLPTEMVYHFFKSFSDHAMCNLNMKVTGDNEHHKIESLFKAFARAIKEAKKRDVSDMSLPTTKGVL